MAGLIPPWNLPAVLHAARLFGVVLTPYDLFGGAPLVALSPADRRGRPKGLVTSYLHGRPRIKRQMMGPPELIASLRKPRKGKKKKKNNAARQRGRMGRGE